MSTQVESYEVEEINSSEAATMAADSASIELIESLGLTGQKKLTNPETGTREPYREWTSEEKNVFETLFPVQTRLEDYDLGPIPLRVLQIAAHAKELEVGKLYVLHSKQPKEDPILVAQKSGRRGGNTWDSTFTYLLARWGDSLPPFETLRKKAFDVLKNKWEDALTKMVRDATTSKSNLDNAINRFLDGDYVSSPSHSVP